MEGNCIAGSFKNGDMLNLCSGRACCSAFGSFGMENALMIVFSASYAVASWRVIALPEIRVDHTLRAIGSLPAYLSI